MSAGVDMGREDLKLFPVVAGADAAPEPVAKSLAAIPPAVVRGLLSFPADALKVFKELGDGEFVQPASYVAANIGVSEKRVKEVHRALRTLGFADYGVLTREDDGLMCGAGYWVSTNGLNLLDAISQAAEANSASHGEGQ